MSNKVFGHWLHCNQEEWFKERKLYYSCSPTNEAEDHLKLLANEHNSKISTMRESSADVDLEISSSGFMKHGFKKCLENDENLSNIIPMPLRKSSK